MPEQITPRKLQSIVLETVNSFAQLKGYAVGDTECLIYLSFETFHSLLQQNESRYYLSINPDKKGEWTFIGFPVFLVDDQRHPDYQIVVK